MSHQTLINRPIYNSSVWDSSSSLLPAAVSALTAVSQAFTRSLTTECFPRFVKGGCVAAELRCTPLSFQQSHIVINIDIMMILRS